LDKRPFARDHVNLERGLIAGAALVLTGLGLCSWLVGEWHGVDFGPLDLQVTMRYALWGFTTIVLGVQTMSGSCFLSILGMTERAKEARRKALPLPYAA
jgi:hypothetical protein